MNLPVVGLDRHLSSQIAMLHKAARVGVAFHAMVLAKRYGLSGAFAKFVFAFDATATTVPLRTVFINEWVMFSMEVESLDHSSFLLAEEAADDLLCRFTDDVASSLVDFSIDDMNPRACLSVRCGSRGTTSGSVLTSITREEDVVPAGGTLARRL